MAIRKTALSDLVTSPLPAPLIEWGSHRSSAAMLMGAKMLDDYSKSLVDEGGIAPLMDLLENLVDSHPEILRSIVSPAVRALREARNRNDLRAAERLERLLLLLAGASPATLVAGVLVSGNWRFRPIGKKKRKRAGGRVKNKPYMVGAIRGAATDLRNVFILPATERLSRQGYRPMVDRLALVLKAVDSVISVASGPATPMR